MAKKGNPNIPPGPGRPKGCKNKITANLKDRVVEVWQSLEKKNIGLNTQAEKDPRWFLENFLKPMLPKDVKIDGDMGITINIVRYGDDNPTE